MPSAVLSHAHEGAPSGPRRKTRICTTWTTQLSAWFPAASLAAVAAYRELIGASLRARWQYRTSFAFDLVSNFLSTGFDFVAILVIFHNVRQLGGWSVYQVALLYGAAGVSFGFTDLAVGQLDNFSAWVRDGRFDVYLVRPVSAMFQVVTADFSARRFGKIAQAGLVLVIALIHLDIAWNLERAAMLLVMLVCGSLIYSSVWIGWSSVAFWTTEIRQVTNAFTYGGNFLASYPINIFDSWVRGFLAFVLPMAFVAYYPSLFILGKPDPLGGPRWMPLLTPLVAGAAALASTAIWTLGIRHYRSTGS